VRTYKNLVTASSVVNLNQSQSSDSIRNNQQLVDMLGGKDNENQRLRSTLKSNRAHGKPTSGKKKRTRSRAEGKFLETQTWKSTLQLDDIPE